MTRKQDIARAEDKMGLALLNMVGQASIYLRAKADLDSLLAGGETLDWTRPMPDLVAEQLPDGSIVVREVVE